MTNKIEVGKCYRRRDGEVTGPMEEPYLGRYSFRDPKNSLSYPSDGKYWANSANLHRLDLIFPAIEDEPLEPMNNDELYIATLRANHRSSRIASVQLNANVENDLALAKIEIDRLRVLYMKSNEEICQTLGRVLGYPWFCDDRVNFPGATKADGICQGEAVAETIAEGAANKIVQLKAGLTEAIEALRPFADAAFGLNDTECSSYDIWEHSTAMNITVGDLRRAKEIVEKHKGGKPLL